MTAKEKLHEFVDGLSEDQASEALATLTRDPVAEMLENAPLEDEPISEEEERLVEEGRQDIARGDTVSLEAVRRELS